MLFQYERVPRWILVVGVIGTLIATVTQGFPGAAGFALGTLGSWWNYIHLERIVKTLGRAAIEQKSPSVNLAVAGLFIRLFVLGAAVLVILKYSKISLIALLTGLFASCIAIVLEIVFEAVWSTKSG